MSKKFYAFEFKSGRNTTTGTPNESTGNASTAGYLAVFSNASKRDSWVAAGRVTSDMRGNCRETVTAREARSLCLGMSVDHYNEYVSYSLDSE